MNIVLFDFDNTITNCDTYTKFVYFSATRVRKFIGSVILFPLILLYKRGRIPGTSLRKKVSFIVFCGRSKKKLYEIGKKYAQDVLPEFIRPIAIEKINWHKTQGDKIVLVSASLDLYLLEWCKEQKIDLICTELETWRGICTGRYVAGDCCGPEKKKRIMKKLNIKEYDLIYAYGDSDEDAEMLELASEKFYKWKKTKMV
jgi:HAD superfamily hydrolase (TIGR01490 family)